jgi:hypothetical protein
VTKQLRRSSRDADIGGGGRKAAGGDRGREDFGDGEGDEEIGEFGGLRGEKYFCEHLKSEYATVNEQG